VLSICDSEGEVQAADPSPGAFLTSWAGLVEEGVGLECERTKVKELPRYRRRRNYEDGGGWDYEEQWDRTDEGYEDEDEEGEGGGTCDTSEGCVGWNGWPENWPATVG